MIVLAEFQWPVRDLCSMFEMSCDSFYRFKKAYTRNTLRDMRTQDHLLTLDSQKICSSEEFDPLHTDLLLIERMIAFQTVGLQVDDIVDAFCISKTHFFNLKQKYFEIVTDNIVRHSLRYNSQRTQKMLDAERTLHEERVNETEFQPNATIDIEDIELEIEEDCIFEEMQQDLGQVMLEDLSELDHIQMASHMLQQKASESIDEISLLNKKINELLSKISDTEKQRDHYLQQITDIDDIKNQAAELLA